MSYKDDILTLREMGLSYAQIASELHLPLGSVKSVLSRAQVLYANDLCDQCNCLISDGRVRRNRRFCCDSCRAKWWMKHRRKTQYLCKTCGMLFESRKPAKYCSRECYYQSRRNTQSPKAISA